MGLFSWFFRHKCQFKFEDVPIVLLVERAHESQKKNFVKGGSLIQKLRVSLSRAAQLYGEFHMIFVNFCLIRTVSGDLRKWLPEAILNISVSCL